MSAMTPSTVARVRIFGHWNAFTSGLGRARPDVSMMMWSGGTSRSSSFCMVGRKSSATVQQMQPLASSMMSSSGQASSPQPFTSDPSTPTSPNSLMMRASRRPPVFSMRWRISVVFPAPRNPVMTVAGTLLILSVLGWG